jgi:hypothetical protein
MGLSPSVAGNLLFGRSLEPRPCVHRPELIEMTGGFDQLKQALEIVGKEAASPQQ